MEEHAHTNHLIHEKSPYLLQHAHNPVDWYPWGEEAFTAAEEGDKPIFLSIGYATCHWCHVMEQEVFQDEEMGQLMNQTFVNIKVDREELPDVDALYMEFAQNMLGGAAGWPLNLVLTPKLQPFYAATYMPAQAKHGLMGMQELVEQITQAWESGARSSIQEQAEKVVDAVAETYQQLGEDLPEKDSIRYAVELLYKVIDPVYGGIRGAPKFPIAYQNGLLLRHFRQTEDARAVFCVEKTLEMMSRGGIYDRLGGGFSRYSVDDKWLVPHFEKMLYDNALLAESYFELWQVNQADPTKKICESILDYVRRDMTHKDGGFFSAEDADSEGREGLFYTWTPQEVEQHLSSDDAKRFISYYGLTNEGNFEGRNILFEQKDVEDYAEDHKLDPDELRNQLEAMENQLWKIREERERPFKDDKILSAWNGLMIHSLAIAGAGFGDDACIESAVKAARFIKDKCWIDGHLKRRWREGEARFSGGLDEYAFVTRGLLTLFEVTGEMEWLQWAMELEQVLATEFKIDDGAYYQNDGQDANLLVRQTSFTDGAEPSGNAVQAENLLRLYQMTVNEDYKNKATDVLRGFTANWVRDTIAHSYMMMVVQRYYDQEAPLIVVALNEAEEHHEELRQLVYSRFIPNKALIWKRTTSPEQWLPHLDDKNPVDGNTTLYICYEGRCQEPITDLEKMKEVIRGL